MVNAVNLPSVDAETHREQAPIIAFSGFISHDLKTLLVSSVGPSVEVVHFDGGPPPAPGPADEQRICHRSRTAIKIK